MMSIVVKRLALITLAVAASGPIAPALAAKANNEALVVARLYKDFGWQAFVGQPELFGDDLAHQRRAVLNRYFAPSLTDLLVKDAACQIREQGICNLESDLLFDSQDPRVTDLEVSVVAPGRVSVVYADPATGEKTRIDFEVTRVGGAWKIADIIYLQPERTSLKQVLSRKTP